MDYRFTNEYPAHKVDEIVHYLTGPRLWVAQNDYPDFSDWSQKVYAQLISGSKRALVALSYNDVVGVTIYQRHTTENDTLEIKNLSVRPSDTGRYIASFLLRNTEIQGARDFNTKKVTCDAKSSNISIMYFLMKHHYSIRGSTDLYNLKAGTDFVYSKKLSPIT